MEFRVYVARRIVLLFFVLIGVSFLVFTIAVIIPKEPAFLWAGGKQIVTEQELDKIRELYHLNEPWYMQYLWYLSRILQGDLGISAVRGVPIATELKQFLPPSLELGAFGLIFSTIVGIAIGIVSATKKDTWADHISRLSALSMVSLPAFWIGLVFQIVLYYQLGIFADPGGSVSQKVLFEYPLRYVTGFSTIDALITGNWPVLRSLLEHLIMPGLIMSFYPTAIIARMTRASMLEVLSQDYVRTARAFGLSERIVIYKMALKNAMIPTTTTIGHTVGWLMTGSVVVETIFYWPGIGRYAVEQIQNLDFPALIGYVMVAAFMYAAANLIVDVLYGFLDPRIRQG